MALLAGPVNHEQRTAHPVIRNFQRAFALVGHVAIRAGNAGAGVNSLAPGLKFRMLRLEDRGASFAMLPVEEAMAVGESVAVVIRYDLVGLEALVPREKQ